MLPGDSQELAKSKSFPPPQAQSSLVRYQGVFGAHGLDSYDPHFPLSIKLVLTPR